MANSLQIDLIGKVVIFRQHTLSVVATDHPFLVTGGFGASSHTHGRTLGGVFLSDGEDTAMSGYDVERLATDDEIGNALISKKEKLGIESISESDSAEIKGIIREQPDSEISGRLINAFPVEADEVSQERDRSQE